MKFAARSLALVVLSSLQGSCIAVGSASGVTPLQKVLDMLTGMLDKSQKSKHAEVVQWTAYKQWCTDTEKVKQTAVQDADDEIETLKANILKHNAEINRLGDEIKGHEADAVTYKADVKNATAARKVEHKDNEALRADYTESIYAIKEALKVLKEQAHNRPQVSSLLQAVKLPPVARRAIDAFLAESSAEEPDLLLDPPEAYAYEFQSDGIIALLEKLLDKFESERLALEKAEMGDRHSYESLAQDLSASTAASEHEAAKKKDRKMKRAEALEDTAAQYKDTVATRNTDAEYLKELEGLCLKKMSDFGTRQKLREEEIQAITKAIDIIKSNAVSGAADKHLRSMVQTHKRVTLLLLKSALRSPSQEQAALFLKDQSEKIGSRVLSAIATHVEEDPFTKVKKMIQELILKLQAQAAEEASHKAWCDDELASNKKTRSSKSAAVETLQASIEGLESSIAKLKKDIASLSKQLSDLQAEMATASEMRTKEKETNEDTIADAVAAQMSVQEAIQILNEFYGKAGAATVLVQASMNQKQDQPEIFSGPYKGQQKANNNVIAFLDVIKSQFAHLESQAKDAEDAAKDEFKKFMDESEKTKGQLEKDISDKESESTSKGADLQTAKINLESEQKELDAAMAYFDKLKPSCLITSTSSSFSDRVERREQEIASLKEALAILSGETIVDGGPQAMYSSVDGGNIGMDVGITANLTSAA